MLQHQVARISELLSLHNPLPRGLHHIGVIIDDLVVLEQILTSELCSLRSTQGETWVPKGSGMRERLMRRLALRPTQRRALLTPRQPLFGGSTWMARRASYVPLRLACGQL